jgi:hypothetical protein
MIDQALFFPTKDEGNFLTFTDANWTGNVDLCHLTFGILHKYGTIPIAWTNKLPYHLQKLNIACYLKHLGTLLIFDDCTRNWK